MSCQHSLSSPNSAWQKSVSIKTRVLTTWTAEKIWAGRAVTTLGDKGPQHAGTMRQFGQVSPFSMEAVLWSTQNFTIFSSLFLTSPEQCLCSLQMDEMLSCMKLSCMSLPVQSPSYLQARLFILHLSRYQSLPVKDCPLAKACPCNLLQTTCSACAPILTASPTEPISTVIKQRHINLCLTWGGGRRSFKLLLKGISDYQLT